MDQEYACDWCGKIVVGELYCEDYDSSTGVCGSMICEKCKETLFSEEQIARMKAGPRFRVVEEFTGQLLGKGNLILLEST